MVSTRGRSKELLEEEIKLFVEQFLQERGLELSPATTVITHVGKGFDSSDKTCAKYPNGKVLIKPGKNKVKTLLASIRKTTKAGHVSRRSDLPWDHFPLPHELPAIGSGRKRTGRGMSNSEHPLSTLNTVALTPKAKVVSFSNSCVQ